MKLQKTKKIVKRIEYHVAAELKRLLFAIASDDVLSSFNGALVTLMSLRLRLDYPARASRWWVDDLEWTQLSTSDAEVKGTGKIGGSEANLLEK